MDINELERLAGIVQSARIWELTIRQGDSRVTIRAAREEPAENEQGALVSLAPVTYEYDGMEPAPIAPPDDPRSYVRSPVVGVFHHVKPVIGLGARVVPGQVVGVIEAMKLVNEVIVENDGVVTDVLIEDGLPVEYGQVLFEIRPE